MFLIRFEKINKLKPCKMDPHGFQTSDIFSHKNMKFFIFFYNIIHLHNLIWKLYNFKPASLSTNIPTSSLYLYWL